ncbi:DUF5000 domain-containing lipoprotein [Parapedobacter sp.]
MSKIRFLIGWSWLIFTAIACKEESPTPILTAGGKPAPVYHVEIENLPGGAKLQYELPDTEDLLYVKAVYEFPEGYFHEVKASAYVDTLIIEGLGNTNERDVTLYAVSRSEVESEPVSVKISPLTPPVYQIASSFVFTPTFGGISVSFENVDTNNVVINLLKKVDDEWTPVDELYTKRRQGTLTVRNQEATEIQFGAFVKDRWNNKSDTVNVFLTPLFEIQIPNPVPITALPGDYHLFWGGLDYSKMVDGSVSTTMETWLDNATPMPQSFTLDFRVPTQFSRFKYFMYPVGAHYEFNYACPEKWEIWGSNELTDDWNNWAKIMDCVAVKPSGAPLGVMTQEDQEASRAGLDFDFPEGTPPYRYIRWKTTKTFGGMRSVGIAELTFWGNQINN